jgi:hypothetical protein
VEFEMSYWIIEVVEILLGMACSYNVFKAIVYFRRHDPGPNELRNALIGIGVCLILLILLSIVSVEYY